MPAWSMVAVQLHGAILILVQVLVQVLVIPSPVGPRRRRVPCCVVEHRVVSWLSRHTPYECLWRGIENVYLYLWGHSEGVGPQWNQVFEFVA